MKFYFATIAVIALTLTPTFAGTNEDYEKCEEWLLKILKFKSDPNGSPPPQPLETMRKLAPSQKEVMIRKAMTTYSKSAKEIWGILGGSKGAAKSKGKSKRIAKSHRSNHQDNIRDLDGKAKAAKLKFQSLAKKFGKMVKKRKQKKNGNREFRKKVFSKQSESHGSTGNCEQKTHGDENMKVNVQSVQERLLSRSTSNPSDEKRSGTPTLSEQDVQRVKTIIDDIIKTKEDWFNTSLFRELTDKEKLYLTSLDKQITKFQKIYEEKYSEEMRQIKTLILKLKTVIKWLSYYSHTSAAVESGDVEKSSVFGKWVIEYYQNQTKLEVYNS